VTSAGNGEYYANILCNGGLACKILDLGGPVIVEVQTGNARTLTFIIVGVDCLFTNGVIFDLYAVNPDFVQRNLQILGSGSDNSNNTDYYRSTEDYYYRSYHNCTAAGRPDR